ncbi:MAG: LysM peptidoglycan-binding domain-containing protein, partial [Lachnospiraceae bacterium]
MVIHVVKPNETVNSIAAYYGLSADRIIYDNELYIPNRLAVGQALLLLFPEVVHTVVQNDTLYSISQAYGISVLQIVRNNPYLLDIGQLEVGQNLVIQYTDEPIRDIRINGYAYPYIDTNILRETLLYLTDLSIFSYGFTTAGELIPPSDNMLIETAQSFGVNPILVLTPLTEDGTFNNQLVK